MQPCPRVFRIIERDLDYVANDLDLVSWSKYPWPAKVKSPGLTNPVQLTAPSLIQGFPERPVGDTEHQTSSRSA